jgi:hypothetical protein
MTVTYIDQAELSVEQQAMAIERIEFDRGLITEAILAKEPDRGQINHVIEFPLVLDSTQAAICKEAPSEPERIWFFLSYKHEGDGLIWRVRILFEFEEYACCHGEWAEHKGHISVAVPVDQDVVARIMTCDETIELLEASCLYELQKNARELLLKEVT